MNTQIHPVLKEMLDTGCNDQCAVAVAFGVYLDLAEDRIGLVQGRTRMMQSPITVKPELWARGWSERHIPNSTEQLQRVKAVLDLKYNFCKELNLIYLTAKENEVDAESLVYVPLSASQQVSPEWLAKVHRDLSSSKKSVILAFKDTDSTVVYYNTSEGLTSPESPEEMQSKKSLEDKKKLIQAELWRKRNQLYDMAKNNSSNDDVD